MLQHSNMAKNTWQGSTQDAYQKMNTELWPIHPLTGSNKHGKNGKVIRFTDLVKLVDMAETASGSNVQSKQSTCYRNLT